MTRRLHPLAVHVALVAMLLRALLPAGWMPSAGGEAPFTICTADGATHTLPGTPHKTQDRHEVCPFAAAPHVAAPIDLATVALPSLVAAAPDTMRIAAPAARKPHAPQAPRGPPAFA
ncbi:MAG TPA: hypothetical protein VG889_18295 [Rhizomicrobium sp.]|nr:hypothetical protein [Rhizomicrobium sp.]